MILPVVEAKYFHSNILLTEKIRSYENVLEITNRMSGGFTSTKYSTGI